MPAEHLSLAWADSLWEISKTSFGWTSLHLPFSLDRSRSRPQGSLRVGRQRHVIFLEEVGECDLETQAKLLRVLQLPSGTGTGCRTIRRVGNHREIPIDVRVIAATNRDLHQVISAGTFREDLFYRLSVFSITLPPLRERRSDIPHITDRLLTQINRQFE